MAKTSPATEELNLAQVGTLKNKTLGSCGLQGAWLRFGGTTNLNDLV